MSGHVLVPMGERCRRASTLRRRRDEIKKCFVVQATRSQRVHEPTPDLRFLAPHAPQLRSARMPGPEAIDASRSHAWVA